MLDHGLGAIKFVAFGKASMQESIPQCNGSWEEPFFVELPSYKCNMIRMTVM